VGPDTIVATHIHYLREKIDAGTVQRLVHTMRGVGYVLRTE
jgi:DNA-binding response OmpR family regulator